MLAHSFATRVLGLLIAALLGGCYALEAPVVMPQDALVLPDLPGHYELQDAGDDRAELDIAILEQGPGYRFRYRERDEEHSGGLWLAPGRDGVLLAQIDIAEEGAFLYFCRIEGGRITILSSRIDEAGEKALAEAHGIELVKRERYGPVTPVGQADKVLAFLQAVSAGPLEATEGALVKVSP